MVDTHRRCDALRIAHSAAYRLSANFLTIDIALLWPVAGLSTFSLFSSCNDLDAAIRFAPTSIHWHGDIGVGTYSSCVCSAGGASLHGALARLASILESRQPIA